MSRVRIAVAGAGLIGRRHIELIGASEACELAAIADPAAGASALAAQAGVPLYRTLGELLAAGHPDGVIVATPNAQHLGDGLACVEHGVPVLVEKPVADSVADATLLAEAAERANVPLLVGHHRRHGTILKKAREVVHEGRLGQVVAVMGSALFFKPNRYFDDGPWRRQAGGGPILINMIHEVDSLRWLCGEIAAVQAFCSNETRVFEVEDTVSISLRFASGALGTFILSDTAAAARNWEHTSGENPDYPHYGEEECCLIAGTRGSLSIPSMRLKTYPAEANWWLPFDRDSAEVRRADPLALQLNHFCEVVRREVQPLVTGRDATQTLRATLAIAEAARSGTIVTLD